MPNRPNTPCRHPGCAALIPYGTKYCEVHKPLHPEEVRSASDRGYGKAWQKARKRYLEAHTVFTELPKNKHELGAILLKKALADGPVESNEIKKLMVQYRIGDKTLNEVKNSLGIKPFRKMRVWYWVLPGNDNPGRKE